MSKLTRWQSDRGAITSLLGLLLASGVLIGVLALVIDTGQVLVLRQQVRNAADNVAQTLAIHCAKASSATDCLNDNFSSPTITNRAMYAQPNAEFLTGIANPKGGAVSVDLVCGHSLRLTMAACPTLTGSGNDCATDLASDSTKPEWVRVYTSLGAAGFTPILANLQPQDSALSQGSGSAPSAASYQESACAQAYWNGASAIAPSGQLPLMVGDCEAKVSAIGAYSQLTAENAATSCNYKNSAAASVPGNAAGFWEYDAQSSSPACWTIGGGTCRNISLVNTKTGSGIVYPQLSYSALLAALSAKLNTPVLLPLVQSVTGGFEVRGFTQFTLVAYRFPSWGTTTACKADSWCSSSAARRVSLINYGWTGSCVSQTTTSPFCLAGYFGTRAVAADGQTVGLNPTASTTANVLGYQVIRRVP